jgi:hypothetical protein
MFNLFSNKTNSLGQATIEFALVGPIFFILLFFCITGGLYAFERSSAVTAVTAGAKVAAGGISTGSGANTPALLSAENQTVALLKNGLLGTQIIPQSIGVSCPPPQSLPASQVYVCATRLGLDQIRIEVSGNPSSFVPPSIGGLKLPIDVYAQVYTLTFKT